MVEKIALLAGTFDPPTKGHVDLIFRAAALVDKLFVAIGENPTKDHPLLSSNIRKELLEKLTAKEKKIEIIIFQGLTTLCAKKVGADFLIRGIRTAGDFEKEIKMAEANRKIGGVETIFLSSQASFLHISGHLIKEIHRLGGSVEEFVPPNVYAALRSTFSD